MVDWWNVKKMGPSRRALGVKKMSASADGVRVACKENGLAVRRRRLRAVGALGVFSLEPGPRPSTPKALRPLRQKLYASTFNPRPSTLNPAEDNLRVHRGSSFTHPRPSTLPLTPLRLMLDPLR